MIPTTKRLMIFVDAQNLLMACMNRQPQVTYDVEKLVRYLVSVVPDRELSEVFFYSAIRPPDQGNQADLDRYAAQQGFFDSVRTKHGYQVFTKKTVRKQFRCRNCGAVWTSDENKGIDVALATDLIVYGLTEQYEVAMIVSGDSDYATAINRLRATKPSLRIEVAQFSNVLGHELRSAASCVHELDSHVASIQM